MRTAALLTLIIITAPLHAQKQSQAGSGYDLANRATLLHTANVYVSPDASAPPVATIDPGHEVVVQDHNGPWVNIFIATEQQEDADPDSRPSFEPPQEHTGVTSGWIRDRGIVGPKTPHGDLLIYGAAAEFEAQAEQPHSPTGAAAAAHRLYERVADYFPDSPLVPEAVFRAADIRWQLERADIMTLPSAHEQDAYLRPQIYEGELRAVLKYFPNTPQAARAAFDLLGNKLCGDWQGLPRCPEMETALYMNYARQYRGGPKSAEAMYDAAFRQGALVTMYNDDDQTKLAQGAAKNCQAIADQLQHDYPNSDFAARAAALAYKVSQGIPITGSDRS
jgi:hypothetical protein